ncbi:MAG: hypothetical protein PSY14_06730 [bacterium]|nr:hypothetical protein [bacterium]
MFTFNSFKLIASIGGQALYLYASPDNKATIEGAGYFNDLCEKGMLNKGDGLFVFGDNDGAPYHSSYVVASNDGSAIALTAHAAVTQQLLQSIRLGDISSKNADAAVIRFVAPFAGTIAKIRTVLNAALATGDATFTAAINGVAVTNGVVTATQAASAAGDRDEATPTAAKTFVAGDLITITVGGASTATATAGVQIDLTPT